MLPQLPVRVASAQHRWSAEPRLGPLPFSNPLDILQLHPTLLQGQHLHLKPRVFSGIVGVFDPFALLPYVALVPQAA